MQNVECKMLNVRGEATDALEDILTNFPEGEIGGWKH